MAFFGEPVAYPDHAVRAVRTALDMNLSLNELRQRWYTEGILPPELSFQIGIGLNSGQAFVGLLGSEQRINYTAIGDNVNYASRLQDLTKTYKWPILITTTTYEQINDEFDAEFVDNVIVKKAKLSQSAFTRFLDAKARRVLNACDPLNLIDVWLIDKLDSKPQNS